MPGLRPLLLLLALVAMPAFAAMHGQPLVQRYRAVELPVGPAYNAIAADSRGTLYAGGDEGVLAFRSGAWEAVDLPRKAAINALLHTSTGALYVGGPDLIGELRTDADGSLRFVDMQARFFADKHGENFSVAWIVETSRGIYFRTDLGLLLLGPDGKVQRWTLPNSAREFLFAAGDAVYIRLDGVGLCRVETGVPIPVPGAAAFAKRRFNGVLPYQGGVLLVGEDGLYVGDAQGVRKLTTDADAAFAAHPPYVSLGLPDGSFVVGGLDGTLMRFSPDLKLLEHADLGGGSILAMGMDREGGLWAASAQGLERLRLPAPWTAYTLSEKFGNRIYDSAFYDGALWLATDGDVLRAQAVGPGEAPKFVPQHWTQDVEAFALQATDSGLVIGAHSGLLVLDPGAKAPRALLEGLELQISRLLHSAADPQRLLALGQREAFWLSVRNGRWELTSRWNLQGAVPNSLQETQAGEIWIGNARGGAERWRFDAAGEISERRRFGAAEGLPADPTANGTHLFHLDDTLFAITGDLVQKLSGERFIGAELPELPGLSRPSELESVDTGLGTFVWTTRQIWQRQLDASGFRPLQLGAALSPGYRAVKLQEDGQLRLATWENLLQFDPRVMDPELPPLHASLDHVGLRLPDKPTTPLPVAPKSRLSLPPMAGLALRFGLDTMEPNPEFRYRMVGYTNDWSAWTEDRVLGFRRLPPGDFTLELQARSRSGRSATMLSYPVRVDPAWYEETWMQALFALGALLALAILVLGIVRLRYRQVLAQNRQLAQHIAERTAELEAANRKLAEQATRDGLTGVGNRRALEQALDREWQRCRELGQPLAVVMADVDHFKQFNDRHGHQEGDTQLKRIAQALESETAAPHEMTARYGGEEFALVMPCLTLSMAAARAEEARRRVETATLANGMPSTVSFGVAVMQPLEDSDPFELVRYADAALYQAKREGRNRVAVAIEPAPPDGLVASL